MAKRAKIAFFASVAAKNASGKSEVFYLGKGEFLCAALIRAFTDIAHKKRGNRPYNGRCPRSILPPMRVRPIRKQDDTLIVAFVSRLVVDGEGGRP